jgi:hypothetical protein
MFVWTALFLVGALVCLLLLWRELRRRPVLTHESPTAVL